MNSSESDNLRSIQILKKCAEEGFLEFCLASNLKYQASWFHEVLTSKLQEAYERVQRGEKVRLILQVPPRHGKSQTATIDFPAWILGKDPTIPVITCSYSSDLSEDFGQKTRDIIQSPLYKKIFSTEIRQDSSAKSKWLTTEGGGYTATGVGGAITGKGFKIGIIDDPLKNRQDADSATIRETLWSWWKSTFYTRQEGTSAIIVIQTRWHQDDLVGRLLEQQAEFEAAGTPKDEYDQWEVINFPAIAEKDEKYRKKGEPLWPEKFSLPDLMTLRNGMDVYDWSALYQQEPILSEDAVFQSDWFKYFTESDIYQKSLQVFVTVDPAIGQRETSDNTSIMVVGKDRLAPEWYLLEENTGKMDPGQIVDFLFFLKGKYKDNLVSVGIEAVAYQKSLLYYVNERMVKTEQYFDVQEIKAKGSKEERIKGLVPLFKNGVILFRQSYKELEREFLQFPKGKHDDRIDSLSMQLQLMPQTKRNFFAPQWRPHLKRY